MQIEQVRSEEMAAAHLAQVVAELRHDRQVTPLLHEGIVPGEETVPGLQAEGPADTRMRAEGELHREVHRARGVVCQVVADREDRGGVGLAINGCLLLLGKVDGSTSPGVRGLLGKGERSCDRAEEKAQKRNYQHLTNVIRCFFGQSVHSLLSGASSTY